MKRSYLFGFALVILGANARGQSVPTPTPRQLVHARAILKQTLTSHLVMINGLRNGAAALIQQASLKKVASPNPARYNTQLTRGMTDEKQDYSIELGIEGLREVMTSPLETLKTEVKTARTALGKLLTKLNTKVPGVDPPALAYWTQPSDQTAPPLVLHPANPQELRHLLLTLPPDSFDEYIQTLHSVDHRYVLTK